MFGEASTVSQFSFFIIFALLGSVISLKLRQPYVVGLLVFGMLSGPNVLGIINDKQLISTFSEIGAILLLFAVGIEFSLPKIMRSGLKALVITFFKMGALFLVSYEVALFFGMDLTSALVVGTMFSISSTTIMFKMLSEKGMAKGATLSLLFSMLILEDFAAIAALTFFSAIGGGDATYEDKLLLVFLALGFLGVFYSIVRKPAQKIVSNLTSSLSIEIVVLVSFSLCLLMSMIADFIGLSPAIGAFLAGSIISGTPNSRKIESSIKPLIMMFASLFFLSLGMQIDPEIMLSNVSFSIVLTLLFLLVCFFSVLILLYLTGSSSEKSIFGASATVVLGEFSLLIASTYKGEYSSVLLAAGSFGVVATTIVSSFLLDRQKELNQIKSRFTPDWLYRPTKSLSIYTSGLIRDFSPKGAFWKVSRACWSCISWKLAHIAGAALAIFLIRQLAIMFLPSYLATPYLRTSIVLAGILYILYYFYLIFLDLRPVLDTLSKTITRHKKNALPERIILRDATMAVLLALLAFHTREIAFYLKLPGFFFFVDKLLILLILVLIWDILRQAGKLGKIKRG